MKRTELNTKRLLLRSPRPEDWKDIVEGVGAYEVAAMTKNIPHPYHKKDAVSFIAKMSKKWSDKVPSDLLFFLELKTEKKVIGAMGLHELNIKNGTATTGSWVNKKYWRQGYITEAKIAVNDFAFNVLKLRRLTSDVVKGNKASNETQKKVGYKLEGVQRKGTKSKITGKIQDVNLYGLLKEDWKKARTKLVNNK